MHPAIVRFVRARALGIVLAALAFGQPAYAAESGTAPFELPEINVVSTSPVGGTGIPLDKYPGNVQIINYRDMPQDARTPPDMLNQAIGSMNINNTQGNPYAGRPQLPRLYRLAGARHAAGRVRLPRRHARQRALRRRGRLGSDTADRNCQCDGDSRLQSGVRAEHAGRRGFHEYQERLRLSRRRGQGDAWALPVAAASTRNKAGMAKTTTTIWRPACTTTAAGRPTTRAKSASSSANSAFRTTAPISICR